jgi:hypothetical protein
MKLLDLKENSNMYTAYVLDKASRLTLAEQFPPIYSDFIGHHITVEFGVPKDTQPPPSAVLKVVGHVDSGDGLEALVVSVNGETQRPDGKVYHITWSLERGKYKPVDSNRIIATHGYKKVPAIAFSATPAVL